jgi:hypothetical protein
MVEKPFEYRDAFLPTTKNYNKFSEKTNVQKKIGHAPPNRGTWPWLSVHHKNIIVYDRRFLK